jgi:hypothetical protein
MAAKVHLGLTGIGKSEHDGAAVRVPEFYGQQEQSGAAMRPFIGKLTSYPEQDLLLCAKHLFVAAIVAWVHPGLPGIDKSSMMAGKSARPWARTSAEARCS